MKPLGDATLPTGLSPVGDQMSDSITHDMSRNIIAAKALHACAFQRNGCTIRLTRVTATHLVTKRIAMMYVVKYVLQAVEDGEKYADGVTRSHTTNPPLLVQLVPQACAR